METVTVRLTLLLALASGGLMLLDALAAEAPVVASPPFILRLEAAGVARLSDGRLLALPAGSEIDACGDPPLRYALSSRVVHVTAPCTGVFRDGFEVR